MRAFVLGSVLLLASAASGYHLGHGPADTPEVAAAKAAHFAAHAAVKTGHGPVAAPIAAHHHHWDHAPAEKAWHGPIHIPVIHKGVPVEPKEVQHAKAEHAAAYAKVQGHGHYAPAPQEHYGHHGHHEEAKSYGAWHGPQHVPVIHNGVPVETAEVQHAKAFHLNALANAGAHSGYAAAPAWGHGHEDDGSYDPAKYEHGAHHLHKRSAHWGYVPADTPEVAAAKAAHFAAHAAAAAPIAAHHQHAEKAWHGPIHIPVIHNGVPVETPEVQHAKAFHLNALANAGAHSGYAAAPAWGHGHEDDGSYDPAKYEHGHY